MLTRLVVAVLCVWPSVLSAATRYVDIAAGSDSNTCAQSVNPPGGSYAPKQHLTGANGALNCMSAGDTLYVRAGNYDERIDTTDSNRDIVSGTSWSNPTRILAYPNGCSPLAPHSCSGGGDETVWIRPTDDIGSDYPIVFLWPNVPIGYVEFSGLNWDGSAAGVEGAKPFGMGCDSGGGANHIRFKNGEVIGARGHPSPGAPVIFGMFRQTLDTTACPGDIQIQNLKMHATGFYPNTGSELQRAGAFYANMNNILIEDCEIYDTRGYGGTVSSDGVIGGQPVIVTGTIIRRNVFHDIWRGQSPGYAGGADGLQVAEQTDGTQVYDNVFYNIGVPGNEGIALTMYSSAENTKVWNNTVYNTAGIGINLHADSTNTTLQNNISYGSTQSNYDQQGTVAANDHNNFIGTDPVFVSAGTANFHLAAGSPMIDVGVCLGGVPTDYDGTARPQGLGCDIGAYEYLPSGSLPGVVACTPTDGATGVDLFPSIVCSSSGATSFDVYFGRTSDDPLFSTTFTAPNSLDIGVAFSPYAAVGITSATLLSNRIRSVSTTAYSVEALTSVTLSADHWCRVQVVTLANAAQNLAGCLLRGSSPTTLSGYLVGVAAVNQTGSWIARVTNGLVDAYLALESATVWAVNDRVQATAVGSTISLYRYPSTTPILTATDTTYSTGRVGLMLYSTVVGAVELDNFEAGNLGLPFIGNQASGTYAASNLVPNTAHQYQFIAKNGVGDTPGPLNSFTTLGTTATPVGIRLRCIYGTANCP